MGRRSAETCGASSQPAEHPGREARQFAVARGERALRLRSDARRGTDGEPRGEESRADASRGGVRREDAARSEALGDRREERRLPQVALDPGRERVEEDRVETLVTEPDGSARVAEPEFELEVAVDRAPPE